MSDFDESEMYFLYAPDESNHARIEPVRDACDRDCTVWISYFDDVKRVYRWRKYNIKRNNLIDPLRLPIKHLLKHAMEKLVKPEDNPIVSFTAVLPESTQMIPISGETLIQDIPLGRGRFRNVCMNAAAADVEMDVEDNEMQG